MRIYLLNDFHIGITKLTPTANYNYSTYSKICLNYSNSTNDVQISCLHSISSKTEYYPVTYIVLQRYSRGIGAIDSVFSEGVQY